mgnify:CR=1 FL=1|jgi:hypothetical protein
MEVEWIDDARREGHFSKLSIEEQNEYMDTLYWLDHTQSKVKDRASEVYISLRQQAQRSIVKMGGRPGFNEMW